MIKKIKINKIRLDELLVKKKFCENKSKAKGLILAGKVKVKDQILDKPGKNILENSELTILNPMRFVSRGGLKLEGFLQENNIDVNQLHVLDIGASTGGFTDCLLQNGAKSATCVDVGYGQLHYKLRINKKVINIEKLNARFVNKTNLPRYSYDLICIDLSFISLKKVLENLWNLLDNNGLMIVLVKPQFEAKKEIINNCSGVIKEESIRISILEDIYNFILRTLLNSTCIAKTRSCIKGANGNHEFFIGIRKSVKK